MPKGPKGEKRPRDVSQLAKMMIDEVTGNTITSPVTERSNISKAFGGLARAKALPKEKRIEIAANAAKARWAKVTK